MVAVAALGCASSPERSPAGEPRDRTADAELTAAREAARPDFETQADALAAGVYEPFVHPDSVRAAVPDMAAMGRDPGGDPSTAELLGTLGEVVPYNGGQEEPGPTVPEPTVDIPPAGGEWTLQLGAFESETGALVRIRQIAGDFPGLPRWYVRDGGRVRVFVGRFADRTEAERQRALVAESGHPDVWVTRVP
jgi:hypothetical protein